MTREDSPAARWRRFVLSSCVVPEIGMRLDVSRMHWQPDDVEALDARLEHAFDAMAELEGGAIANPDEGRQVGHYWLRSPSLAPEPEQRDAIEGAISAVLSFVARVHEGILRPAKHDYFTDLLVIGVGGSALGPQLVADALGDPDHDALQPWFIDNTDPEGMDKVLRSLGHDLGSTLVVVISKSGGTPETRNAMLVVRDTFAAKGLDFSRHAVAITGQDSALDRIARDDQWLARFPMWDWIGGRTSETSVVGLLPAALQGLDIKALLDGARAADDVTRRRSRKENPAALLALMWHLATNGRGERDMVVLPYRDRLLLFSRYLQQLIMESLGKDRDLDGNPVSQGLSVYGNKGSTDQHAYVQQLREGIDNFFVTFIHVLKDGDSPAAGFEVEPDITSGDYLRGFYLGTRQALHDNGRQSMTLVVDHLDAHRLGALIAIYERAVGLYAYLINVNAYHQPGVEAGKKAASAVLERQRQALRALRESDRTMTAEELAENLGEADVETLFHVLDGLASNGRLEASAGSDPFTASYGIPAEDS